MMDEPCVLCKEKSPSTVAVTDKGRRTLVASSLARDDDLHKIFETVKTLRVHSLCRKNYTRKPYIPKKSLCQEENVDTVQLRSIKSQTFDIKTHCIFCTDVFTADNKLPCHRRRVVSNVETLEFHSKILDCARQRHDEWGNEVSQRVEHICDLVAAEAKYHRICAQKFFTSYIKEEKLTCRQEAFNKLCKFLDENDECQYSMHEISKYMETFLEGEEGYGTQYLKTKLKEHYGENIVLTCIPGKSTIVSFP